MYVNQPKGITPKMRVGVERANEEVMEIGNER
jgi:hypothetical protein